MIVFVDTSALLGVLDRADVANPGLSEAMGGLDRDRIVTHGYVAAETVSLVRRRLGSQAAVELIDRLLPTIDVRPVDAELHGSALDEYRAARAEGPSFVDRVSFAFMRREGISIAFCVDRDFEAAGFRVIPEPSPR